MSEQNDSGAPGANTSATVELRTADDHRILDEWAELPLIVLAGR
jgi:hypothetical protein